MQLRKQGNCTKGVRQPDKIKYDLNYVRKHVIKLENGDFQKVESRIESHLTRRFVKMLERYDRENKFVTEEEFMTTTGLSRRTYFRVRTGEQLIEVESLVQRHAILLRMEPTDLAKDLFRARGLNNIIKPIIMAIYEMKGEDLQLLNDGKIAAEALNIAVELIRNL